jgi:hypothetical protein
MLERNALGGEFWTGDFSRASESACNEVELPNALLDM